MPIPKPPVGGMPWHMTSINSSSSRGQAFSSPAAPIARSSTPAPFFYLGVRVKKVAFIKCRRVLRVLVPWELIRRSENDRIIFFITFN